MATFGIGLIWTDPVGFGICLVRLGTGLVKFWTGLIRLRIGLARLVTADWLGVGQILQGIEQAGLGVGQA